MIAVEQNQIARSLSSTEGVSRVQSILASGDFPARQAVARRVCEQFGFRDQLGRLQLSTCMTALARLERAGRIELPFCEERGSPFRGRSMCL